MCERPTRRDIVDASINKHLPQTLVDEIKTWEFNTIEYSLIVNGYQVICHASCSDIGFLLEHNSRVITFAELIAGRLFVYPLHHELVDRVIRHFELIKCSGCYRRIRPNDKEIIKDMLYCFECFMGFIHNSNKYQSEQSFVEHMKEVIPDPLINAILTTWECSFVSRTFYKVLSTEFKDYCILEINYVHGYFELTERSGGGNTVLCTIKTPKSFVFMIDTQLTVDYLTSIFGYFYKCINCSIVHSEEFTCCKEKRTCRICASFSKITYNKVCLCSTADTTETELK